MPHQQDGAGSDLAPLGESAPAGELDVGIARLGTLLEQARALTGRKRRRVADELNASFLELGRRGGSRAVADFLGQKLESGALAGLEGSHHRSCRAAAVEALISMGFPFALEVSPDDLEHLRASTKEARLRRVRAVVLGLMLVAGAAGLAALARLVVLFCQMAGLMSVP